MPVTTPTSLPAPVQLHFDQTMLSVPVPNLIHNSVAMKKRMPAQAGTTIRFRRPTRLPTSPVPLGPSGVTPPSVALTATDIDAKIDFYGQWVEIQEQVQLQNQDPVLNWATELLGLSLDFWGYKTLPKYLETLTA